MQKKIAFILILIIAIIGVFFTIGRITVVENEFRAINTRFKNNQQELELFQSRLAESGNKAESIKQETGKLRTEYQSISNGIADIRKSITGNIDGIQSVVDRLEKTRESITVLQDYLDDK